MARRVESADSRERRWQRLLAQWSASGLSQAEFCRRRGIQAVTFSWWKRRLGVNAGRSAANRHAVTPAFVEVDPDSGGVRASSPVAGVGDPGVQMYEVLLGNGRLIRVPPSFDDVALARLLAAVEAASHSGGQANSVDRSSCAGHLPGASAC